jgi:hypothetical protein
LAGFATGIPDAFGQCNIGQTGRCGGNTVAIHRLGDVQSAVAHVDTDAKIIDGSGRGRRIGNI